MWSPTTRRRTFALVALGASAGVSIVSPPFASALTSGKAAARRGPPRRTPPIAPTPGQPTTGAVANAISLGGLALLRPPAVASETATHATSLSGIDQGDSVQTNGVDDDEGRERRFDRTASNVTSTEEPCIVSIDGVRYNLTGWANAHPGGPAVFRRYRQDVDGDGTEGAKDAGRAFEAAGHSDEARKLLERFRMDDETPRARTEEVRPPVARPPPRGSSSTLSRWKLKLFTHEDPLGAHKVLGAYVLLNFAYRCYQMLLGPDPAAGMGSNLGRGASVSGLLCLLPHLALSLSSLIFRTVPRERIVGKPMIWKENRWHSILFGCRSIICSGLAWLSVRGGHAPAFRRLAVWGSSVAVLATMASADLATARLGPSKTDSSVATLPFWEGCTPRTQRRIKTFYASTQFVATSTCLLAANPAWPLLILFPIQLSSFLLTLSRKGLISGGMWHAGYAASLVMPFFIAVRTVVRLKSMTFIGGFMVTSLTLFLLRCRGIDKYKLWLPVIAARIAVGDRVIPYDIW